MGGGPFLQGSLFSALVPAGCTLLFYETYSRGSPEQELSPRYGLLAEDSVVQAVPEHPKKENVFCLSNSYGDVYLFQVASQVLFPPSLQQLKSS